MEHSVSLNKDEKSKAPLDEAKIPDIDIQEGQTSELSVEEERELPRTFSPRQLQVINVGGTVGSGLFIVTGKALADGTVR